MKILLGVVLLILSILGVLFFLVFTQIGNDLSKPLIQKKLQSSLPLPFELEHYSLRINRLDISGILANGAKVNIEADFSLFTKNLDAIFDIDITNLEALSKLGENKFQGSFFIKGSAKGKFDDIKILAASNIGDSKSVLEANIKEYQPSFLELEINGAKIDKILEMLNREKLASGELYAKVVIPKIDRDFIDGVATFEVRDGSFNEKYLKEEHNITLLKSEFTTNGELLFKGEDLNFKALFNSIPLNIESKGFANLKSKELKSEYKIDIEELAIFRSFIDFDIDGRLSTLGVVTKSGEQIEIEGSSDFANSNSAYLVTIDSQKRINVALDLKKLEIEELLKTIKRPIFTRGFLDIDLKISDLNGKNQKGVVVGTIIDGAINSYAILDEFNISVPNLLYESRSVVNLDRDLIDFDTILDSSIVRFYLKGDSDMRFENIESKYAIELKRLEELESIIGKRLNGELFTDGVVSKKGEFLSVSGESRIANSSTKYTLSQNGEKIDIKADIKDLKILELLYIVDMPKVVDGLIDMSLNIENITNAQSRIGAIELSLKDSNLLVDEVNRSFNIALPKTKLASKVHLKVDGELGDFGGFLDSELLNFKVVQGEINSTKIDGIFETNINDLSKFKNLLNANIRGSIRADGKFSKSEVLRVDAFSRTLGGVVEILFLDNNLKVNLNSIKSTELLYMFGYSPFFDSTLEGELDYNILSKVGEFSSTISSGRLVESDFISIVRNLSGFDLTREVYNNSYINGKIERDRVSSNFELNSDFTKISSTKSIINRESSEIDSRIDVVIKDREFGVLLSGESRSPKIRLDAKNIIKEESEKLLEKHKDKIDKYVPQEIQKPLEGIIKNLFGN